MLIEAGLLKVNLDDNEKVLTPVSETMESVVYLAGQFNKLGESDGIAREIWNNDYIREG